MQSTRHPQDDLLIIEALDAFADQLDGTNAVRAARARRLATEIAAEHGLDVADALFQIEDDWGAIPHRSLSASRSSTG